MDDEYRWAGVHDPKIIITTSRNPSSRLKKFAKVRDSWGDGVDGYEPVLLWIGDGMMAGVYCDQLSKVFAWKLCQCVVTLNNFIQA